MKTSIACDFDGNVALAGYTRGSLFANNAGGKDIFAIKLNGVSGDPLWTKQVGSTEDDVLTDIDSSLDNGDFLISGSSMGPFAGDHIGGSDAYVAKIEGSTGEHWSAIDAAAADGWHKTLSSFAVQVLVTLLVLAAVFGAVLSYFYGLHVESRKYHNISEDETTSVAIVPEDVGPPEHVAGKV